LIATGFLWQSLLSPQSRLVITPSSDDPSLDSSLNSDAITVEVPVDDVRVGDSILVLPGETIPVDVSMHTGFIFYLLFLFDNASDHLTPVLAGQCHRRVKFC
jgi:hypothetical protein